MMNINLKTPLVTGLAVLLLALPAWAQDTTEATTETAAETTPETSDSDDAPATDNGDTLDMGEVIDDRAPGTMYSDEVYGDWTRRCTVNPDGDDPCHLYQLLQDDTGQDTAEVSIMHLPDGLQAAAGVTIIVPLQTLLTQQMTVKVDGGQAKRYPFKFCAQIGCVAQIGLTADEIARFKRGASATVTIVPAAAPDQRVDLSLSLTGFTAGFDGLPPITP